MFSRIQQMLSSGCLKRGARQGILVGFVLLLSIGMILAQDNENAILDPLDGGEIFITPAGMENPPICGRYFKYSQEETLDCKIYNAEFSGPMNIVVNQTNILYGDDVIAALTLPVEALPGTYDMRCIGLDDMGVPVGDWSPMITVELIEIMPAPFTPMVSQPISGVFMADFVDIPPGVTLEVVDDFTLLSLGPVNILGNLVGASGMLPGESAPSIRILSAFDINIGGTIQAGAGAPGFDAVVGASVVAGNGGKGGDVIILAENAPIMVEPSAIIASGQGGHGGLAAAAGLNATNPGQPGGDAEATGGMGGAGGDLVVFATYAPLMHSGMPGVFHCGEGGTGGDSQAYGGYGGLETIVELAGAGGGAVAIGGDAGSSGAHYLDVVDFDINGDLEITLDELELVSGGYGSPGGISSAVGGENGAPLAGKFDAKADCFRPNGAKPGEVRAIGGKGGDGWVQPVTGSPGVATGLDGPAGGDGGDATGIGGEGGSLTSIGHSLGGFSFGYSMDSNPADGGLGWAKGGEGGKPSGSGGTGSATGGKGGNAPKIALFAHQGGKGGYARAYGGIGKRAPDCCNLPQANPHNGGNGGTANASGGDGGTGMKFGGDGGNGSATGGKCGNGGDGNGPSAAGIVGPANANGGNGGSAIFFNGDNGTAYSYPASACAPGKQCAPKCSNGAKKIDASEPIDGTQSCVGGTMRCAVFCPSGDMNVVSPILRDESGAIIVDLPGDRYGIEIGGYWFEGSGPTDHEGRGTIPVASLDMSVNYSCDTGYIISCGVYLTEPMRIVSVDLNADGVVGPEDLALLTAELGTEDPCYDLTGDGFVDFGDVDLLEMHMGHSVDLSDVMHPIRPMLNLSSYPNPFNPETVISYELPAEGLVKLQIVDLKGNLVCTLVDEVKGAGIFKASWNGRNQSGRAMAAGVYLAVLDTPEGQRTGKLALIK